MTAKVYQNDLPEHVTFQGSVAIDTEAMGLNPHRDRLCLVQMSAGDGRAVAVQIAKGQTKAPRLEALLADPSILKIFHFARFDIALLYHTFGVLTAPVYCTKIASKLCRTYTDRHGLKDVARELAGVDMSKAQQSSDWGAPTLTDEQRSYAANDVLYLHQIKEKLDEMLVREGRMELAEQCFGFLPTRAQLDIAGWADNDIFSHS